MSLFSLFNTTMAVYVQSYTVNQIGERVETLTHLRTIPCRINRLQGRDIIHLDNIAADITVRVYCDVYSDFEEWDHVVIDDKDYRINNFAVKDTTKSHHHLELDCYIKDRK